jgi:hypothetical protein
VSRLQAPAPGAYRRHRPETTALYGVVRDNLETLYGAIGDGAIAVRIPKQARKELEAYLDCGLLVADQTKVKVSDLISSARSGQSGVRSRESTWSMSSISR